jgi:hypothetical protein
VPAALDGHQQAVLAGERHGPDDVGRLRAAGDQRRAAVDRGVPDGAGGVVAAVAGAQEPAAQPRPKGINGIGGEHRLARSRAGVGHGEAPPTKPYRRAEPPRSARRRRIQQLMWRVPS